MTLTDRAFRWKPGPRSLMKQRSKLLWNRCWKRCWGRTSLEPGDLTAHWQLNWIGTIRMDTSSPKKAIWALSAIPCSRTLYASAMIDDWSLVYHPSSKGHNWQRDRQGGSLDGLHREWTQALLGFGGGMTVVWSKVFLPRKPCATWKFDWHSGNRETITQRPDASSCLYIRNWPSYQPHRQPDGTGTRHHDSR